IKRVLDDGLASRMQMQMVERKALAYAVGAGMDGFTDCSVFEVGCACAPRKAPAALAEMLRILAELRETDVPEDELLRAKKKSRIWLEFSLDSPAEMIGWFGAGELLHPPAEPFDQWLSRIDRVAAEALLGRDPAVENGVTLFRLGALYGPAVRDGDFWRIGSYALLHIGWIHLLVNSYALWILAPQLEITYGSNLTLGLFCATAIAGGAASAAWSFQTGTAHLAAGASGGIFGLFGATVALYFRVRKGIPEPVRRGIVRAIALNLLINLAIALKAPVDNAAHLGGLLSGVVLGLAAPLLRGGDRPWHRVTRIGLLASALALAALEGAAVARAVKPRPRTLRGPG